MWKISYWAVTLPELITLKCVFIAQSITDMSTLQALLPTNITTSNVVHSNKKPSAGRGSVR